jgi:hypothetical protein
MRNTQASIQQVSEHLRHVEALLEPIRRDGSINDAERRRQISDVLAAANARALSLHAERRRAVDGWRWHRELARTG